MKLLLLILENWSLRRGGRIRRFNRINNLTHRKFVVLINLSFLYSSGKLEVVHIVDFVESTKKRHTKHLYNEFQKQQTNKQTNKTKQASRGHFLLGYLFQNILSLKFPFLNRHWIHFVDLEIFITSRITSVDNKSSKYYLPLPCTCLFCLSTVTVFFSHFTSSPFIMILSFCN